MQCHFCKSDIKTHTLVLILKPALTGVALVARQGNVYTTWHLVVHNEPVLQVFARSHRPGGTRERDCALKSWAAQQRGRRTDCTRGKILVWQPENKILTGLSINHALRKGAIIILNRLIEKTSYR
jgi:hypothetical protein